MRAKYLSCLLIGAVALSMILVGSITQVQAAKKKEIVFGGPLSISGKYAEIARLIRTSFKVWVDDVNKAGGIYVKEYGRKLPVRHILYDDQSDPATGAKLYEKLITHDKVDFLTAPFSSGITFSGSTVAEKYKKIMISYCGSSDDIFTRGFGYTFAFLPVASTHLDAIIDLAIKGDLKPQPKTVAMATVKELFTLTLGEGIKRSLKGKLKLVVDEMFLSDLKDASSIITKVKTANPDIFLALTRPPSAALFTKQMKEFNLRPKMVFIHEGPSQRWYIEQFKKDAEGMLGNWPCAHNVNDSMALSFNKRIKKVDSSWTGKSPDTNYHMMPYGAAQVLQKAIEGAGTLDNRKVAEYIRSERFTGIILGKKHEAKFEDRGNYRGINVLNVPAANQVQNGESVCIWPKEFSQAKVWYPLGPWQK